MWCHVMKSSDLVSKAKQSVPSHYHPPESPVVGCSDSMWKWPQDGERFQVISARKNTCGSICFLSLASFAHEIGEQCKIQTQPFLYSILQLLSPAHHQGSSAPYRHRLEWLDAISAMMTSWKPPCIPRPQTWVSTSYGKTLSSRSTGSGTLQRCLCSRILRFLFFLKKNKQKTCLAWCMYGSHLFACLFVM